MSKVMRSIELLGTVVAPAVREAISSLSRQGHPDRKPD